MADELRRIVGDKPTWERLARAAGVTVEDFRKVMAALQAEIARGFVEMGKRSVQDSAKRCSLCGGTGKVAGQVALDVLDGPLPAEEIIAAVEASRVPCPRCTPRGRAAV